ncbi:uncharacterized protein PgNI_12361 [Pyricularia grisea]|uniref:CFEM domain-containing protein n=1 Tax=Pyricularia grisea TaxID=148305 RepID=A0A6P8AMZ1_PYRGI|nr:uncharacterized protein PgNI_12361 [Pyricularia grisea]TLD03408.1 hypothetical protein PgNI_12361 [Pyricularia grisea]
MNILLFLALFITHSVTGLSITDLLDNIPLCAYPCLSEALASHACHDELEKCICSNFDLQAQLSVCAQRLCSFEDQLVAVAVEADLCAAYPKPSRTSEVQNTVAIGSALLFPVVALRIYSRKRQGGRLWRDDYAALTSMVLLVVLAGIDLYIAQLGFGMHYWTIPIGNGHLILKYFYIGSIVYIVLQTISKVSFLLLLGQVFPGRRLQKCVQLLYVVLASHGCIYSMLFALQCLPVKSIWDRHIRSSKCLDIVAIAYSNGALSILEDIAILILPFPEVWRLNMGRRHRVALLLLFSVGLFACITSMVRMNFVVQYTVTLDSTWDNVDIVIWSFIEQITLTSAPAASGSLLIKQSQKFEPACRWHNRHSGGGG